MMVLLHQLEHWNRHAGNVSKQTEPSSSDPSAWLGLDKPSPSSRLAAWPRTSQAPSTRDTPPSKSSRAPIGPSRAQAEPLLGLLGLFVGLVITLIELCNGLYNGLCNGIGFYFHFLGSLPITVDYAMLLPPVTAFNDSLC
jgi:hypothetical protein